MDAVSGISIVHRVHIFFTHTLPKGILIISIVRQAFNNEMSDFYKKHRAIAQ